MAAFELRENNVTIFVNKGDAGGKAPVITGKVNVNGTIVKLAGWHEKSGNGMVCKLSTGSQAEG